MASVLTSAPIEVGSVRHGKPRGEPPTRAPLRSSTGRLRACAVIPSSASTATTATTTTAVAACGGLDVDDVARPPGPATSRRGSRSAEAMPKCAAAHSPATVYPVAQAVVVPSTTTVSATNTNTAQQRHCVSIWLLAVPMRWLRPHRRTKGRSAIAQAQR